MPSDTQENREKIFKKDEQYDYSKHFKAHNLPKSVFIDGFEWLIDKGNPLDVHPGGAFQIPSEGGHSPGLLARKAELEKPYELGDEYAIGDPTNYRYNIGKPKWKTKIYEFKKGWEVVLKRVPDVPPGKEFPFENLRFKAVPQKDEHVPTGRAPMLDPGEDTARGGPRPKKDYDIYQEKEDKAIAESD